jgi:hypothetical protein
MHILNNDGMSPLARGVVIAERFTIEALAGRGGMGSVYRALDSRTGQPVALKLMHAGTTEELAQRFEREAVLLSRLSHPRLVAYIAHGATPRGQPYLAMEWLEGEDLAQRLARQPLSLAETLVLLRGTAEALATAHQQGIVHRDLKPSNLFLRAGRPEDVVVLDFGLARQVMRSQKGVTRSGVVLGSAGYMAPEQASSQEDITPSADIFSLGCVLYECLTGTPPFEAPHFVAALAKILFAEPAPLHTLRPGLPPGLQALVDQMLVKDARRRLPDALHLRDSLLALEPVSLVEPPRPRAAPLPARLVDAGQQLVSVLLVSPHSPPSAGPQGAPERGVALRDSLRLALAPYGGQVELLTDGSLVVTLLPERGTATDQAVLAARCALSIKERCPEAAVVLVTGLGVLEERLPVGAIMDGAGQLLRQLEQLPDTSCVLLNEVTAGLLGPGFRLSRVNSGTFVLQGEQLGADASRPLLGKSTPCVGREQELALLEFTFNGCLEEPRAQAVLVTAPPGAGKSRLRHEFLRRLERREQPPLVLLGRGDPMSVGASYGLVGQALRRLCGMVEGESLEASRERLSQRVLQHLPEARAREAVEFLGELCAIPFPEEASPRLRAARGDPRLMSTQMGRALATFLEAECAHQPVLLVLEDLHWSDALSVKLVDELLRALAAQPFMVLTLARPEVTERFPHLWPQRMHEVQLRGLSRKAGARLVREVLGPRVPDAVVQRALEQADGNALFLEELIRMLAEGRGEEVPETVLASLQARLTRMEAGPRQVLLAASVFGRTFWGGGVQELLGWQGEAEKLEQHLRHLVEQEVIELQPTSHFPGLPDYRFRHALVRDAAYSLVPESQRPTGHRLAAGWLERMGEPDVLVLATHYQLGQEPARAVPFYSRATEQLFERDDLPGCLRCVEAAKACGASGAELARLNAIQAVVAVWMYQMPTAMESGAALLEGVKAGSALWCKLVGGLIFGSAHAGDEEQAIRLSELLMFTTPEPEALAAYTDALASLGIALTWKGARPGMEFLLGRMEEVGSERLAQDAVARGWLLFSRSYFFHYLEARPWQAFVLSGQGTQAFLDIGSEMNAHVVKTVTGAALVALGDRTGAVELLREALAASLRAEQHLTVNAAEQQLMWALAYSPEPSHWEEAQVLARQWAENGQSDFVREGIGNGTLARLALARGELGEAEALARKAIERLGPYPVFLLLVRATRVSILLAQGRAAEARQEATAGVAELEQMENAGAHAVAVRLALAEACFADGDVSAGEDALRKALQCVRTRASDIPEGEARERFLRQVPENVRTLELAHQRWGESA